MHCRQQRSPPGTPSFSKGIITESGRHDNPVRTRIILPRPNIVLSTDVHAKSCPTPRANARPTRARAGTWSSPGGASRGDVPVPPISRRTASARPAPRLDAAVHATPNTANDNVAKARENQRLSPGAPACSREFFQEPVQVEGQEHVGHAGQEVRREPPQQEAARGGEAGREGDERQGRQTEEGEQRVAVGPNVCALAEELPRYRGRGETPYREAREKRCRKHDASPPPTGPEHPDHEPNPTPRPSTRQAPTGPGERRCPLKTRPSRISSLARRGGMLLAAASRRIVPAKPRARPPYEPFLALATTLAIPEASAVGATRSKAFSTQASYVSSVAPPRAAPTILPSRSST